MGGYAAALLSIVATCVLQVAPVSCSSRPPVLPCAIQLKTNSTPSELPAFLSSCI